MTARCSRFIRRGVEGRRLQEMGVEKASEKYRCDVCGNEVVVTKVGGGTLVCCNQEMEKIE